MLLYTYTPLDFRGKYYVFYSTYASVMISQFKILETNKKYLTLYTVIIHMMTCYRINCPTVHKVVALPRAATKAGYDFSTYINTSLKVLFIKIYLASVYLLVRSHCEC